MKKNVYLLLALLMLGLNACDNEPKFKVQGKIFNAEDKMLYFEMSGLEGVVSLDSVKLDADGVFNFAEARPQSPEFYRLRLDGRVINFAIDSIETVSVESTADGFDTAYTIEGSENNQKIKELSLKLAELRKALNVVSQNRNMPVGIANDSISAMINRYKDMVKREYILKAPNTAYAYYALFQSINGMMLFDPMSNKEDIKCFQAVATSMNNSYPHADRSRNLYNMVIKGLKNTRTPQESEFTIPAELINEASVIDIELKDLKGNVRRLTDLKGKVVLIDFMVYDNTLAPAHNLLLRELYDKYHERGLEIYQISLDANEHFWKTSVDNLPWICVRDPQCEYSKYVTLYNVQGLPSVFLMGRDNELKARGEMVDDIEKAIVNLL